MSAEGEPQIAGVIYECPHCGRVSEGTLMPNGLCCSHCRGQLVPQAAREAFSAWVADAILSMMEAERSRATLDHDDAEDQ